MRKTLTVARCPWEKPALWAKLDRLVDDLEALDLIHVLQPWVPGMGHDDRAVCAMLRAIAAHYKSKDRGFNALINGIMEKVKNAPKT